LKYKDLLYIEPAKYRGARIVDAETVTFTFIMDAGEFNCLIDKKTGKPQEGSETEILACQYLIELKYSPEAHVDIFGHSWKVMGFERIGVNKQLV
jgi:hypothetical protein